MEKTNTFKNLIVWQKAHELVLNIYKETKKFPKDEVYALTNQLRRASISIAANIAEGYKKKTIPNKINFLNISEGSLEEVKYYIILSKDLEYISNSKADEFEKLCDEIGRLINGYSKAILNKK
ncbi:MAG: four helix bundle protein [Bacteroidia bacterium]|nr:four helix bundle protein [Bacteroidia bacterium]